MGAFKLIAAWLIAGCRISTMARSISRLSHARDPEDSGFSSFNFYTATFVTRRRIFDLIDWPTSLTLLTFRGRNAASETCRLFTPLPDPWVLDQDAAAEGVDQIPEFSSL